MMLWVALFALPLCIYVYVSGTSPRITRNGQRLRRPPQTLPFLGNGIHFLQPRTTLFKWFIDCQKQFGAETFEISVPGLSPGVVINSPENLEYVLKNEASITKGNFFTRRLWDLFGYGIVNASGELWKAQRKAGLKFLNAANLDILIEDVLPEAYSKARRRLVQATKDNSVVDLQEIFLDVTTTVVGQMAYDASMDIDAASPFSQAFEYASDCIGLRFQNPMYRMTEIFTGSRLRAAIAEVKRFGRQIVRTARARRGAAAFESLVHDSPSSSSAAAFGSLIDALIEAFPSPTVVADAALSFLSAGRDTTAQSLTWTFYALMRNPAALPALRREIDTITGELSVTTLQAALVPQTMAVFYEALRLYPPIPMETKQCVEAVTLPDGTFLPASAVVVWCIWAMNRAESVFGPDAEAFRPERWVDDQGKLIRKTAFEFPVFNGGPRVCLGKKMAEAMGCWLIVRMWREFEFEEVRSGTGQRVCKNSLTLPMEGGLPVTVRVRKPVGVDDHDG